MKPELPRNTVIFESLTAEQRESLRLLDLEDVAAGAFATDEDGAVVAWHPVKMFFCSEPVRWQARQEVRQFKQSKPMMIDRSGIMMGMPRQRSEASGQESEKAPADAPAPSQVEKPRHVPAERRPAAPAPIGMVMMIPEDEIAVVKGLNPRTVFGKAPMEELENSMREDGFHEAHPLEVRSRLRPSDGFDLVTGNRRLLAARAVFPKGYRLPCVVVTLRDDQVLKRMVIENDIREDFLPMDRAMAYDRLLKMKGPDGQPVDTVESLARQLGRKPRLVEYIKSLARLAGSDVAAQLNEGAITMKHAFQLARVPCVETRSALLAWLFVQPEYRGVAAPVEMLRERIAVEMQPLRGSGFDPEDETLMPMFEGAGGKCSGCMHNSVNFDDDARGEIEAGASGRKATQKPGAMCLHLACYRAKQVAAHEQWRAAQPAAVQTLAAADNAALWNAGGTALEPAAPYVEIDEPPAEWELKTGVTCEQPWKTLVRGQGVAVVVARDAKGREHTLAPRQAAIAAAVENRHDIFKGHVVAAAGAVEEPARTVEEAQAQQGEEAMSSVAVGQKRDEKRAAEELRRTREQELRRAQDLAFRTALRDAAARQKRVGRDFWGLLVLSIAENAGLHEVLMPVLRLFGFSGEHQAEATKWVRAACADNEGMLPEPQLQALALMLAHATVFDDERPEWERLAEAALEVDAGAVRTQAAYELDEQWRREDAERASVIVWSDSRTKAKEFNWEGPAAVNPSTGTLAMPEGYEARVFVARSEKGWHAGWELRQALAAEAVASVPCAQGEGSCSQRALAVRRALEGLQRDLVDVHEHLPSEDVLVISEAIKRHLEALGDGAKKRTK